jgi:HK97 family phage major capsid protein
MTQISNELIADALVNVMDDIAAEAGHALAYQMDKELILGDGTGTYGSVTGLVSGVAAGNTVTLASTKTAFTDITLADLHSCVSKVGEKFFQESQMAWIMLRSTYAEVVQQLVYAAGGNTVDSITGGQRPALFGYPIFFTDHMPASAASKFGVFFGNFAEAAVMGDRQGVEVATSADYGFNLDVMTVRLTSRYDINVHENDAYAGIKTAAS